MIIIVPLTIKLKSLPHLLKENRSAAMRKVWRVSDRIKTRSIERCEADQESGAEPRHLFDF
jgi:hypothetical protein